MHSEELKAIADEANAEKKARDEVRKQQRDQIIRNMVASVFLSAIKSVNDGLRKGALRGFYDFYVIVYVHNDQIEVNVNPVEGLIQDQWYDTFDSDIGSSEFGNQVEIVLREQVKEDLKSRNFFVFDNGPSLRASCKHENG